MELKRKHAVVAVALVLIIAFSAFYTSTLNLNVEPPRAEGPDGFYLGVTYSGDSVTEAKQLIDRVKGYTNLIVIQSGALGLEKINAICDYAVESDMNFIVYFGYQHSDQRNKWMAALNPAWENNFLGVYFGDELGGKMLDSDLWFTADEPLLIANKYSNGTFSSYVRDAHSNILFQKDGSIVFWKFLDDHSADGTFGGSTAQYITYYPNGTITCEIQPYNQSRVQVENTNAIPLSYSEIWNQRPFQTYDEAAEIFVANYNHALHNEGYVTPNGKSSEVINYTSFTADYALYWYDYRSGCDIVLAEIGWNQSLTQDIALARGAATLQNKNWGAMITWKYMQPPYLDSGDAIYDQMCTAYEAGAKYIAVFNYAKGMTGPYGILQQEHFDALKRFWNEVTQNKIVCGSSGAEAVLVLPHNYGWGMRNPQDNIWGLWSPDEKSPQVWNQLQNKLTQFGTKLDVVYEDQAFPVTGKYSQIFYWNSTN